MSSVPILKISSFLLNFWVFSKWILSLRVIRSCRTVNSASNTPIRFNFNETIFQMQISSLTSKKLEKKISLLHTFNPRVSLFSLQPLFCQLKNQRSNQRKTSTLINRPSPSRKTRPMATPIKKNSTEILICFIW